MRTVSQFLTDCHFRFRGDVIFHLPTAGVTAGSTWAEGRALVIGDSELYRTAYGPRCSLKVSLGEGPYTRLVRVCQGGRPSRSAFSESNQALCGISSAT